MRIRNRVYPVPVLSQNSGCYVNSIFSTTCSYKLDGYNIVLNIGITLKNPVLEKMLIDDKICILHHVECSRTFYRKEILVDEMECNIILRDKNVNGLVEITSFLIAKDRIIDYRNPLFSDDYLDFSYSYEKGAILAIGNQYNLRIEKIRDDLTNTSSIFSIIPDLQEKNDLMKLNLNNQKIVISLPEKTYRQYCSVQDYMEIQPLLHTMVIIPALVQVINELKLDGEQLFERESYRWFRSLKKSCMQMGIVIDAENLKSINALELAQKLIDRPLARAIEHVAFGGNDED